MEVNVLHVSLLMATAAAAVHDVNPSSAHSFSTVLCHVSLGHPLLLFPLAWCLGLCTSHVGFWSVPCVEHDLSSSITDVELVN